MFLIMSAPLGWLRGLLLTGLSVNVAAMILNSYTGTADNANRIFGFALCILMASLVLSLGSSRLLTKIALILGVLLLQGIWFDALYLSRTPEYRQIALFSIALWLPFFYLLFFFIFGRKTAPWLASAFIAAFTLGSLPHTFVTPRGADIFNSLRFLPLTALAHLLFVVTFHSLQQRETELAQLRADQGYLKHLAEHDLLTGLPTVGHLKTSTPNSLVPSASSCSTSTTSNVTTTCTDTLRGMSSSKTLRRRCAIMLEWATSLRAGAVRSFSSWHRRLNCLRAVD